MARILADASATAAITSGRRRSRTADSMGMSGDRFARIALGDIVEALAEQALHPTDPGEPPDHGPFCRFRHGRSPQEPELPDFHRGCRAVAGRRLDPAHRARL